MQNLFYANDHQESVEEMMDPRRKKILYRQISIIANSAYGFPPKLPNNPEKAYDLRDKLLKKEH